MTFQERERAKAKAREKVRESKRECVSKREKLREIKREREHSGRRERRSTHWNPVRSSPCGGSPSP